MPRRRKPTELKVLEGTYRPDRDHGRNSPKPAPGMPDLPEGWADGAPWGEEAVEEFYRLGPGLVEMGLLSPAYRAAFLLYCDAWGRFVHYRQKVGEGGAVQTSESGYEQQRPAVSMLNRAAKDVKGFLSLFGLAPSERSRAIVLGGGEAQENAFDEFRE